jgi:3-isopropylmalate/(R)-2-methylmalate dehydratase small subunit
MILEGKIWKMGDNIDTDVIIPARYLTTSNPEDLAIYCMVDYDKDFTKKITPGDIIVAGDNFGCGSSREHAPIAIKAVGISCIIAKSFSRIFFRNAINIGLPIFESKEIFENSQEGDILQVNADKGVIINMDNNEKFKINPLPEFIRKIISSKGLVEYTKKEVKGKI